MRIIAGEWRGRKLAVPEGVRPMLDRERERLFAILGERVAGARVLDLFSGTGAIGLEALSRGAAVTVSVENGHRVLPILKKNVAALAPGDRHRLVEVSAFQLPDLEPFDLVIAAPPFPLLRDLAWRERFQGLFGRILGTWLTPGGEFVLEMPAEMDPGELTGLGPPEDTRRTAASRLAFWSRPVSG
ncbi:MAG: RsmD family RNA methyltransferase [Planctomycetota bacterium]|jgi:16S rRNA (guanine966-N2)-methyltransferase